MAINKTNETPCTNYQYAAATKDTNNRIGACNIALSGAEAKIGWILHRDYWKKGYGSEMGKAILDYGFGALDLDYCPLRRRKLWIIPGNGKNRNAP